MKRNKFNMQNLMSGIFAFLLTILFTVLFAFAGFGFGVFNDLSINRSLNGSNYYYEVQKVISQKAEETMQKAGLPVTVLGDAISVERVYIGEKNYVEDVLSGSAAEIKTDKLRSELSANIDGYLTEKGITRTAELDSAIGTIISSIETDYKNALQLQFVNLFTQYRSDYTGLMKLIVPIIVILIGALSYLLIRMHHYKHRGIRYITYALIASSLITVLTAGYLLITSQYDKLKVTPDYYLKFLTAYLKWDMTVFLYVGGIGLILSSVLISLTGYLKNKITEN